MYKILVLDANQRSALAATRALGKKGISVVTGDATRRTLAGSSKYSAASIVYPSPYDAPAAFVSALSGIITQHRIDTLFPMTDVTTALVLKHRAQLQGVRIAAPDFETYDTVCKKIRE